MTIATADRARHLLAETHDRARRAVPDGALRAVVAGGEAAVLGWLAVVVPAIAAYVATAAAPALGEATWLQAAVVGAAVWRMAHGGLVTLASEPITLVPLGLSLLAAGLVAWSTRRARIVTWTGLVAATAGYTAVASALASLPETAVGGWARTALGAAVIGLAGGLLGLRRAGGRAWPVPAKAVARHVARLPGDVRAAVGAASRTGMVGLAWLALLGAVLVGASIVAHVDAVTAGFTALAGDRMSMAMLVLAHLLYLPTFLVWAVAWAAGPGFAVGAGTLVAPSGVVVGPLPAIPVLAALPEAGTAAASAGWAALTLVAVGVLMGWRLHRRDPQARLWASAGTALGSAALTAALAGGLALVAVGGIGPGRMTEFGPDAGAVAAWTALWLAVGALVVVIPARPDSVAFARRVMRAAGAHVNRLFRTVRGGRVRE